MSDEPKPGVIGSLPRTRPHRRSDKRPAPAGAPPVDAQAQEPAVVKAAEPPKARSATPSTARATTPSSARAAKPRTAKPRPAAAKARPAAATPKPAAAKPRPAAATPQPAPPTPRAATPAPPPPGEPSHGVLETAVQAAAELAEIGLHAGARALRRAVSRLPRP
jgi:hypothetical protein